VTHRYQPDETARVLTESQRPCVECPLLKANKIHKVKTEARPLKPASPEARARDRAILGEHEGDE
jgi:hypothetical protein